MLHANIALALALVLISALWTINAKQLRKAYPPGPKADPFIGHLRAMPPLDLQAETFRQWSKDYGSDVIYLEILGKKLVILDTLEAATELLEKRGSNYSDRPTFAVFNLLGIDKTLLFLQYGKQFTRHRKLFQSYFGAKESRDLLPIQTQEAHSLVKKLLQNPHAYVSILESFSASILLRITYGYKPQPENDRLMNVIQKIIEIAQNAAVTMTALDVMPWLKHLPSCFPGTYWVGFAKRNRQLAEDFYNVPFNVVLNDMKEGTAQSSFVSAHLSHVDLDTDDRDEQINDIKLTAAQIYGAGAETMSGTLHITLLALVLHPEVQEKAQAEIDRVVGRDRLPNAEDRVDLPYIEYVIRETSRWNSIVPLSIPHLSHEDDIYRGMFIPKGSMVLANVYSMGMNENVYKEPTRFNPERYIPKTQGGAGEPILSPFGFGKRICPGRFAADNTVWIALVVLLATCKLVKKKDENGKDITPNPEYMVGTIKKLLPFPFDVIPRTNAVTLIDQTQL